MTPSKFARRLPYLVGLCAACAGSPPQGSDAPTPGADSELDAPPESSQPPQPTSPTEPSAESQPSGLAAQICPKGPFGAPLEGTVLAREIPDTSPAALDPADKEFHLYEGAVWMGDALYFSDFRTSTGFPSRILRYQPGAPLAVAVSDSGSNGLALDPSGTALWAARHKSKSVGVFTPDFAAFRDRAVSFSGQRFNSPNDLALRSDGNVYFTDPDFQSGGTPSQPVTGVYRVAPDGTVELIDADIKNPNGIALSLDERFLYVAGNLEAGYVKRYPLSADGKAGSGEMFLSEVVVPDGLTLDCAGNLYVTEHTSRRVRVIDPRGQELGRIEGFERNVTNVAFGGSERRTLYVTTTGALAEVELGVPGLPY